MLLAAVALTVATADYADAIIISVVVLFHTTVGVVQEVRADNAVAALSAMTAPPCASCVMERSRKSPPPTSFRATS
ncbi:MAG: hypothetical protein WCD21_42750 [Streptomyces sp.]